MRSSIVRRRRRPLLLIGGGLLVAAVAIAVAVVLLLRSPPAPRPAGVAPSAGVTPSAGVAPPAAGDSSANIPLNSRRALVLTRMVARHTSTLRTLYLHIKVEGSTNCPYGRRPGYASGTSGVMRVTTHPVLANGRPNLRRTLSSDQFRPCARQRGESVGVRVGVPVEEGQELAVVVRNVDADPERNWFSQNFLYAARGLVGANARNERDAGAEDAHYGLDPRELVGYSPDGGTTWYLPGGPNRVKKYVPDYIQQYADGYTAGQPYFSATSLTGRVTMTYPDVPSDWTIEQLGAYTAGPGSATVRLVVDGVSKASATLSGTGMLRARIKPTTVRAGSTVQVTTVAGPGGLALKKVYADRVWARLLGLGPRAPFYLAGDPDTAATVYPLPGR